jgi:hypothetical protein
MVKINTFFSIKHLYIQKGYIAGNGYYKISNMLICDIIDRKGYNMSICDTSYCKCHNMSICGTSYLDGIASCGYRLPHTYPHKNQGTRVVTIDLCIT